MFCISGPNLVILAWKGDELSCGQARDWYTHTDTQTQAMTIPEGQKLASGKKRITCFYCNFCHMSLSWYRITDNSIVCYTFTTNVPYHWLFQRYSRLIVWILTDDQWIPLAKGHKWMVETCSYVTIGGSNYWPFRCLLYVWVEITMFQVQLHNNPISWWNDSFTGWHNMSCLHIIKHWSKIMKNLHRVQLFCSRVVFQRRTAMYSISKE